LTGALAMLLAAPAFAQAAASPSIVGSVRDSQALPGATSVAVWGHYAYTTAYWAGRLTALDISDPAHPRIAGESTASGSLMNAVTVNVSGGYAYVVSKNRNASHSSNDDGTGSSLTILDIASNPSQPTIVGSVRDPTGLFGAYGVAVAGHYAYVAAQGLLSGQPKSPDKSGGAFDVIDISNPANPSIVATIDNGSLPAPWAGQNILQHADSVSISGNYAYVTASYSNRLAVIDISNPHSPAIVASLLDGTAQAPAGTLDFPVDVVAQGGYAYVADQIDPGRLTVVDVSNPSSPVVAGSVTSGAMSGAYRVRARDHDVFVSAADASSVSEVDVSDPAAPRFVSLVTGAALNHTTGLDVDATGHFVIATSPSLRTESHANYPPFPLQPGGPTNTGAVSVINLDPIAVKLNPPSEPVDPTTSTLASFAFSTNDRSAQVACRLDGGPFVPCTSASRQRYGSLGLGRHTFTVLASDSDGSVAQAGYAWTIVRATPVVSGLRQAARTWREGRTKLPGGQKRPPRIGTVFTFALNESARLTLTFTRPAPGRLLTGRCVAPSVRSDAKPRCTRAIVAGTLLASGHKGSNRIVFTGRVKGRRILAPGRYTLTVSATLAGATASIPKRISFAISPG
jgi:hypothetical protein